MRTTTSGAGRLGHTLLSNRVIQLAEIAVVFIVGISVVLFGNAAFGNRPMVYVGSIWAANVLMLGIVYFGLRSRQQHCSHLGLHFRFAGWAPIRRAILQSLLVFVLAVVAFVAGAVLMANIVGMPEEADLSRFDYLQGNLAMTLLALASVYVVSAFAEEVIYRAFLITRIVELIANRTVATLVAVAASSIVFGLVHSDWGIAGMVQTTCMGVALGASYLVVKRNLWVTILAHAYMDTILILQMYLSPG